MAVIVNNPGTGAVERESNSMGTIVGVIILAVLLIVLLVYGLPALRNAGSANSGGGAGLSVPSKIDVNVNNPGQQPKY